MNNTATTLTLLRSALALLVGLFPLAVQAQLPSLQYFRPYDQRGINVFEPIKEDTVGFDGLELKWGAAFTQQFQALDHSNDADVELIEIGPGFNLATANLNMDVQLADGILVNVVTYLSSRHHPEAWVKAGFFQVDKLPMFNSEALDNLMEYVRLRVGHFEINYGDTHFRRTDNAQALYNPFVGNYIMDAFATEIGGEVYVMGGGFLGMVSVTGGEIRGAVTRPDDRAPAIIGKLGYDGQVSDDLRVRLTGSVYTTSKSLNNTLYSGDRAGSRYYLVLEPTDARESSNFTSGRINPGMRDKVTAFMINPFIKFQGLELFGVIEQATGRAANETDDRTWNQYAIEALYRFLPQEQLYIGGRYNVVSGELAGSGDDVTVDRIQVGGGWFITRNILLKAEYVQQTYSDYPTGDIYHGGEFGGFMIEGIVAF